METKITELEQVEEVKGEMEAKPALRVYEVKTLEEAELEDGTKVQVVRYKEQYNEVELDEQVSKLDAEIEALQTRITQLQEKRTNLINLK